MGLNSERDFDLPIFNSSLIQDGIKKIAHHPCINNPCFSYFSFYLI